MIRPVAVFAAALASSALLAAAASAQPAPARQCFWARELNNWTDDRNGLVYLRIGVKDVYELRLAGTCQDLYWAERIGIETRGGSDHVCSGLDINLIVPRGATSSFPQRCMGVGLRKLTPEEVQALPARLRP
jgi:hypothetical protein